MINLIYTPQRSDFYRAEYITNENLLTVKINNIVETFDFTGLEEGIAEEIIVKELPVNPIVKVEKTGSTINITVIRLYSEDEKHFFENDV